MTNSRIDAIALLAAMIAAGLGVMLLQGRLGWLSGVIGIVLLLILFAYDREGYRSGFQSLAFSVVCGFCLVLPAAAGLRFWVLRNEAPAPNVQLPVESSTVQWLPLIWACASIIFLAIDRARMKNREASAGEYIREPVRRPRGMFDIGADTAAIRRTEVRTDERPAAPQPAPTSASVAPVEAAPVAQPAPVPQSAPLQQPAPVPQPAPIPQPVGVVAAKPGKEVMVYVGLVGEGLNVMRSVRAEHVGRNYYKIIESMPQGETWEFGPGQIVRAEKKKLSSGKALVAVEEAPRKV